MTFVIHKKAQLSLGISLSNSMTFILLLKCPNTFWGHCEYVNIRLMGSPGKLPLMGSLREVINPLYSALPKKL